MCGSFHLFKSELSVMDAFRNTIFASRIIAINLITIFASSKKAKAFYLKYGFKEMLNDPFHLYITLKDVKKFGLA
ncbi:MAG TPA: hypothetical protein VF596_05405 [Pyrinomonadaceae bacterium]|jgi:hypothetical protein